MTHPINRKIFYMSNPTLRYCLREIRDSVLAGSLNPGTIVSDTDGNSYSAGSIAQGKAPKWALSAEHDPMLFGMPPLSEADIAAAGEVLCEPSQFCFVALACLYLYTFPQC